MEKTWQQILAIGFSVAISIFALGISGSLLKSSKVHFHVWMHAPGEVASEPSKIGIVVGYASGSLQVKVNY